MNQTLKDLLKPPFRNTEDGAIEDDTTTFGIEICTYDEAFPEGDDELRQWIIDALNEKYEKDFAEPKRWKMVYDFGEGIQCLACEKCNEEMVFHSCEVPRNYCSSCGQKLLPPERE